MVPLNHPLFTGVSMRNQPSIGVPPIHWAVRLCSQYGSGSHESARQVRLRFGLCLAREALLGDLSGAAPARMPWSIGWNMNFLVVQTGVSIDEISKLDGLCHGKSY